MTLTAPPPEHPVLEGPLWSRLWFRWVSRVTAILAGKEPLQPAKYTVAGVPEPSAWPYHTVIITDDVGGPCLAISDGTIWRRAYDNAEIST